MVAITVILAAVIAAFVMGIGPGDEPVNAAVDVEVDETSGGSLTITITDAGDAEGFELRGESAIVSGSSISVSETGASETISLGAGGESGAISIVATNGESEQTIWSDEVSISS